ncbi:Uncharacterised protein [Chlamydia trachomatis]|nr:Uncharacterised protein [Chlamydia trachomatis]
MQLSSLHSLNRLSLLLIIRWSSLWFWSLRISLLGSKISSSLNSLILLSSSLSCLCISISVESSYILISSCNLILWSIIGSRNNFMTLNLSVILNLDFSSLSWRITSSSQSSSSLSGSFISSLLSCNSSLICSTSGI